VIWLVWVLYQQVPLAVVQWVSLSIFNIIILCRLFIKYALKPLTKGLLLLLTFMGVGLIISYVVLNPRQLSGMPQQSFSLPLLQTHISTQRRVFVDVTASWCITCKINEKTTLNTDKMTSFFNKNDIITITADWTTHNIEITTYLSTFERSGVPLYVFYNREGSPILLPQLLTKKNVMTLISAHIDSEE
jgi:thiol:disulfide interchange protein